MFKIKIELFVGLFILFSVFCFFIIVFKFSDIQNVGINKKYKIIGIFRNIGNLKLKAKVSIYGVKIGYVNKIDLIRNKLNDYHVEVEMLISSNINCIPSDSTASVFMTSMLGDSYVQIDVGNENDFLRDGDIICLTNQALIIEDLISKFALNK
jgi:phospholipid/cholesterol/gamma-HCH transport system substrate-binding protein